MKKYMALLLALCLLTAGCGKGQEAPTTEPPASTAPTTQETAPETTAPETTAPTTEWMDKGIDPMGLHIGMRKVYNRYRLPMIVTENGMAYSETLGPDGQIHDPYRIEYLKEHIEQLAIMIDEGLPVFGYCPWSFVDVVSSHQGFAKRYGLVYVDRTETDPKQCARMKKDSFYWYQKVITNNGLTE